MALSTLGIIAHTQLMPFLTATLPWVARRRVTLADHPHLDIGDEGDILFDLPLLKHPLRARCRVVSHQGDDALCVIASWDEGHEGVLWDLVSLAWQFARALGHPAFKEAALPKQARNIELSYLLGQEPPPSPSRPATPSGRVLPSEDEEDDDLSGIYRMTPSPKAQAPFVRERTRPGKAPFTIDSSNFTPPPPAPAPPSSPEAPEAPLQEGSPSTSPKEEFNLTRRGLPLVLAALHGDRQTGWLTVNIGRTEHRIRLEEGEVIQIEQTPGPDERILRIAAHRLDIDWGLLSPHLGAIKTAKVPEAHLLEEWALSPPQASRLLKQRVQLQMTGLLPLGWSGQATYEADDPLEKPLLGEAPVLGIPLPRLIWAALRARAQSLPRARLESLNNRVKTRSPRWVTDHTFPLAEIRASKEEELAILAFQKNPMITPGLVLPQGQGDIHALIAFWCLTRLGLIRVQPR